MNSGIIDLEEKEKLNKLFQVIYGEASQTESAVNTIFDSISHIESILIDLYVHALFLNIVEDKAFDELTVDELSSLIQKLIPLRSQDTIINNGLSEIESELGVIETFTKFFNFSIENLKQDLLNLKNILGLEGK